ncbi:CHASE2 domain-containing protein [Variovorax sp. LT2P21]|uniref:CHASE2 domain-containing protein n=1 Tax=Variovorax sp. LT2P21 TaxID=3443731 RepID=UPI003F48C8B1
MSAAGETRWKKRNWRWDLWVAIVTVATGLALAWITAQIPQQELAKRAVTRAVSPALTPIYGESGNRAITVVTIDDADLDTFGEKWPLELGFFSRRVEVLLAKKPRVLFIDLLLKRESSPAQIAALRDTLCKARGTTKVYIASLRGLVPDSPTEAELFKEHPEPRPTPDSPLKMSVCAIPVDARVTPDKHDQSQWDYPIQIQTSAAPPRHVRSAALDIFCREEPDRCPQDKQELPPLAMIWPARSFPTNVQTMIREQEPKTVPATYEPACRDGIPLLEAVPGVVFAENLITRWVIRLQPDTNRAQQLQREALVRQMPPCPYHQVIPLRAFNGKGFSDLELGAAFANKIVVLGADVIGTGDKVTSPIHGPIPGVHAHAMALDNLITFEGKYKQAGDFDLDDLTSHGSLFVIISVISTVAVLTLWNHYFTEIEPPPPRPLSWWQSILHRAGMVFLIAPMLVFGWPRGRATVDPRQHFLGRLAFININVALIAFIFVLGYLWLRQGPLSMFEYLLFPFIAHFLRIGKTIAGRSCDWWHAAIDPQPWKAWAQRCAKHAPDDHECAAIKPRT